MIFQAGIVGVFKTVLILLGIFFVLKIIGRIMMARRNMDEEKRLKAEEKRHQEAKKEHLKNQGKVSILKSKSKPQEGDYTDFEIVDE